MRAFYLIFAGLVLASCSTTQTLDVVKISEGTHLVRHQDPDSTDLVREHDLIVYKAKRGAFAKVSVGKDKLEVTPYDLANDFIKVDSIPIGEDLGTKSSSLRIASIHTYWSLIKPDTLLARDWLFNPLTISADQKAIGRVDDFISSKPLWYSDNKWVLQTLTIPFKIRGSVGDEPSNVSTGFNAGIAYGHQWNLFKTTPIYSKTGKKMVGYDQKKLAFSLAPFAGLTAVSLTTENTDMSITKDKSVLGLSLGAAGVFSFNRVNLGLALGTDYGLSDSKDWIYQGKLWTGIVIGLDLIK